MSSVWKANIIIDAQNNASASLKTVQKDLQNITKEAQKSSKSITWRAQANQWMFQWMQKRWTIAWWILSWIWVLAVNQASKLQDLRIELDTLTGSAEKWWKLFSEIQKAASKTPFESTDIVQATSTMLQFGIAQEDVMKNVMMLWDISWGNANKLKSLSLVFWQVASAGKLTGWDLLQMINLWFNPLKQISDKTGESMSSLREKMEDGAISFDMVKETMKDATSEWGLFFWMMDKKSQTFSGVMSTLKDNVGIALASLWGFSNWQVVEGGLLDMITQAVNTAIPYLEKITQRASENPEYARNVFLTIGAIAWLVTVVGTLWAVIPAVIAGFTAIKVAIIAMSWPIWILTALIAGLAIYIYQNFEEIKTFWIETRTSISKWFSDWWAWLSSETIVAIRVLVGIMTGGMSEAIMYIYNNWNEVKTFWYEVWNAIKNITSVAWNTIYTTVTGRVQKIVAYVTDLFNTMKSFIIGIGTNIVTSIWETWSSVYNTVTGRVQKIVDFVSDKFSSITKVINSVKNLWSSVMSWVSGALWIQARAKGWPVNWWQPYLVGEKWPELFVPWNSWKIIPNNKMWWSSNNISINLWGVSINNWRDEQRLVNTIEQTITKAVRGNALWYV